MLVCVSLMQASEGQISCNETSSHINGADGSPSGTNIEKGLCLSRSMLLLMDVGNLGNLGNQPPSRQARRV